MSPARCSPVVYGVVCLLLACGAEDPAAQSAASAAAVAPGTASVFDDALAPGWQDWSWATVNAANASPVASGTRSIAVTFSAGSGLYFHRTTASVAGMAVVSLAVNGGVTAGAHLVLVAVQGSTQLGRVDLASYCAAKSIPQNAWTRCQVPLAAVGAGTTTIDGFWIQEADGVARPAMYFDELALTPAAPVAPAGVTATASATAVALTWGAVTGATAYDVLRGTQSGGPFTRVNTAPLAGTSWTDTAVAAGTGYAYEVTATGPGGTGPASVVVSATVPAAAPPPSATTAPIYTDALAAGWQDWSWATVNMASTAPVASGARAIAVTFPAWGGLYFRRTTATITGLTTLALSVNGGATAGAHLALVAVQGSTQAGRVTLNGYCAGGVIPQNAWATCQVPLSALGPAGTIFDGFEVQEADGVARPAMYVDDVSLSGATSAPAVPAAPANLSAAVASGAVALSWSASSGATGYDVWRAAASAGPFTRLTAAAQAATSYRDAAVTAGATYWYQVTASNAAGAGAASAAASATVPAAPVVPAAPANLTASAATWAVSLSWSAASGATGYDVWRATASAGPFTRLTAAVQAATTYRDVAVAAGATYWYQVTACNAAGTGAASTAVAATIPAPVVTVTLSPSSGAVDACGGKISFLTTVTGSTNTAVTWSVPEGAAGGTVSTTGTYTAPATPGTYHVVATSAASTAATATAAVTVSERVLSVTVSPATLSLAPGATGQFTATVTTSCGTTASAQTVTAPL